jgi:hypothetical protein
MPNYLTCAENEQKIQFFFKSILNLLTSSKNVTVTKRVTVRGGKTVIEFFDHIF